MAIRSFGDDRTMRIDRGEAVVGPPPDVLRRALRLLRAIDAAPDLPTLRALPSLARSTLVEGDCRVSIDSSWQLTFRWSDDDAWNVRVEEA